MRRLYITVCGNIGAGKTTLVSLLARTFGWQPYYEGVANHPYLEDYYKDMHRWGFHTQIYFLIQRFKQQQEIALLPVTVCQDRSIYEDHEIFAKSLYHLGILSERDYATYRELFDAITPYITKPDLLIYLKASVPTLMERISGRSRGFEAGITAEYLTHLNEHYQTWMDNFTLCPVLTVDADRLDFVKREQDRREVITMVENALPEPLINLE
jgi:deoxyadenosine/deoxycytidine kinase